MHISSHLQSQSVGYGSGVRGREGGSREADITVQTRPGALKKVNEVGCPLYIIFMCSVYLKYMSLLS